MIIYDNQNVALIFKTKNWAFLTTKTLTIFKVPIEEYIKLIEDK